MTANYLAETDFLLEAGQMLRGETRKLPTLEHLQALEQLIGRAVELRRGFPEPEDWADWLREAAKITRESL